MLAHYKSANDIPRAELKHAPHILKWQLHLGMSGNNGQPRAVRDRLAPDEYQRLLGAIRAGVSKRQRAKQYGVSMRTVYRLSVRSVV